MNNKGLAWLKGYVRCTLKGRYKELFLNTAIRNNLYIWNFKIISNQQAVFSISISDFFKLKPILKGTYTRVHVIKRVGLPFVLYKSANRKGIVLALIFFVMLVYLFSSIIWTINITGNNEIKDHELYEAINQIGIHRGMFKFQLPSNEDIQFHLLNSLNKSSYIGVKLKGTSLTITVVEKVQPEVEQLTGPTNLVATKDAVIYKILAEKGIAKFKVNDRVKKGDILISGIMGNEVNYQTVVAKGVVEGVVWYESTAVVPLKQEWREYTGYNIKHQYLTIGNRMIKYQGYGEIPYENYQIKSALKQLSWRDYKLPFGIVEETFLEYVEKSRTISEEEAFNIAIEQTKDNLSSKIENDSKILSEKVLHRSTDHGKVTIKILFEVLENIAAPQPIIQGE